MLQAKDLLQVLDLSISSNLGRVRISHIQQLAPAKAICLDFSLLREG